MMRDITIGQYYPADSILHRLDPRVKFVSTLVYIVSLFVFSSWLGYGVAALFLVAMIVLSKVPFGFMIKGLKPIMVLLLITMFFNLVFTPGEVLWSFWILKITKEGIRLAIKMGIRLVFLIIGASIMTLTTTPNQLTDGLERLLRPLNKIHVPVHEIAMMMTIALRFVPTLLEETDKIMSAQKARGADLESGGIISRVKALIPVLIPLFVSSFRRAYDLAMAMECRCYNGGKGRTKMKILHITAKDVVTSLITVAVCAGVVLLNLFVVENFLI